MRPGLLLVTVAFACSDSEAPPSPTDAPDTPTTDTAQSPAPVEHSGPSARPCPLDGPVTPIAPTPECRVFRVEHTTTWRTSLEIEAGAVLEIAPGAVLNVVGDFIARGTAQEPIVLRSQGTGAWGGLHVTGARGVDYAQDHWHADFSHTEIHDAGAGVEAAIVVAGTFAQHAYYGDGVGRSSLTADRLSLHGVASAGVQVLDNYVLPIEPIGFEDVAGPLVVTEVSNLELPLVEDLGGNASPWIEVRDTWSSLLNSPGRWVSQAVPIHLVAPIRLHASQAFDCYETRSGFLEIEPNTVLVASGVELYLRGGRIEADGVTFAPLRAGGSWGGIRSEGDDGVRDCGGERHSFPAQLTLTNSVVRGARSPAIDWAGRNPVEDLPDLTGTTIEGVVAATPGTDVCVHVEGSCPDLASVSTLSCAIPVACP